MRILLWHGWLLDGSGSNVATARLAERYRAAGHDVVLLCQERHPERYRWIDAYGTLGAGGPSELTSQAVKHADGRCVLLRPAIGSLIPVFVLDRYEGFDEVRRFVDLSDDQLDSYLRMNVEALRAAAEWHGIEIAFTGHAIPGAAIDGARWAQDATLPRSTAATSSTRFGPRAVPRARPGGGSSTRSPSSDPPPTRSTGARPSSRGSSISDASSSGRGRRDVPAEDRTEALREAAELLDADPDAARGRPSSVDEQVERALERRDAPALDALADTYDQAVPESDAATGSAGSPGRAGRSWDTSGS